MEVVGVYWLFLRGDERGLEERAVEEVGAECRVPEPNVLAERYRAEGVRVLTERLATALRLVARECRRGRSLVEASMGKWFLFVPGRERFALLRAVFSELAARGLAYTAKTVAVEERRTDDRWPVVFYTPSILAVRLTARIGWVVRRAAGARGFAGERVYLKPDVFTEYKPPRAKYIGYL